MNCNANIDPFEKYANFDLKALLNTEATCQSEQVAIDFTVTENYFNGLLEVKANKFSVKLEISNEHRHWIEDYDLDNILMILHKFGHAIKQLKINYEHLDGNERVLINHQISLFCGRTLNEIELVHCNEYDFIELHGPFERVEMVKMKSSHLKEPVARFDEIFPSLKRFDVSEMHFVHAEFVAHHFEHLTHLSVRFNDVENFPTIQRMLQLNPQLEIVSLYECNWNLLKMISKHLLTLEFLELNRFNDLSNYDGDDIHFDRLNRFRFEKSSGTLEGIERIPLVFGNLKEIICSEAVDKWIDVIVQNEKLKKIQIGELSTKQLRRIVANVPAAHLMYNSIE